MQKEGGAFRITLALLMALSVLLTGRGWAATVPMEALAKGTNTFTLTLYRQLLAQEKGNIFFSPISISLALAMAYGGARGETATEMARVLGYNLPSDQLHPALADLSRYLAVVGNKDGQMLSVANAAWALPRYRRCSIRRRRGHCLSINRQGFPPAAQSFVEGDEIGGDAAVALHQCVFDGIERALGDEHVKKIEQPFRVELQ